MLREVEKPIIVVAQDNTESIVINKDSAYYRGEYQNSWYSFIDQLDDKYEVKTYSFGDKISENTDFTFNEKQTDISELLNEIETRYSNRNLGAIVIASDGLYNKGADPVYTSEKIKTPIYTIALGDTNIKKDLILNKVEYNRIAYLGNKFPIQVIVDAKELKGKNATLTIMHGDQTLFTQKIDIPIKSFMTTVNTELEAKQTGKQHFSVRLSRLDGEVTYVNNQKEIYIDILDGREKVLILADAPHPDVSTIKQALESSENYEVESELYSQFNKPIKSYNLIILHQIPFNNPLTSNTGISTLLISPPHYTEESGLLVSNSGNRNNEAEPVYVKTFSLFTISDELKKIVNDLPAVECPFGNYQTNPSGSVLFYQKIGSVETQNPMMLFNTSGEVKTGTFTGDGLWKWRLRDYAENKNHNVFDEFITKTVQYLSVKVDKSFFRIIAENNFNENENIEIEAELYNDSYELINDPEVSITLINKENKKFPYTFSKTGNSYKLNAGVFPVGDYRYEAKTKVGEKVYTQAGEFNVNAMTIESVNTIADHQLLYRLAQKHNGELFYSNQLSKLAQLLKNKDDIKSISHTENKLTDIINLKWFFFILIFLLSLEWFFRKWNGAY